jgi:uncharacterized repeat protein (TIGR02543 family)
MKNRAFMKKALLAAVLGAALSMGCDAVSEDLETYTVTYDANNGGGTVPTTQAADDGSSVTVAGQGNLTYIGKTFNGWNTNSSGTGTPYTAGASLTVTRDVTLYAQWLTIYYTLTYNANGGSGSVLSAHTVEYGSSVTVARQGDLTYSGKTFNGWNTNSSGTGTPYSPESYIAVFENVTLYAQWLTNAPTQYTVTFDAKGGSSGTQTRAVNSGETVGSNMPSDPTRSGYSFDGWYTAQYGGSLFTGYTSVYDSITVYAQWTADAPTQYTVTFDADGGSHGTQTKTVNSGETLGASSMPSNPTRSGYTFGGWYTARYGSGSQFTGSTSVNSSITVYAKWTVNAPTQYTVTYNANGGSGTAPFAQTVNDGSSATVAGQGYLSYTGKTFTGWNTNSNGTGTAYAAGASLTIIGDVTLYAQWQTNAPTTYTLTYNANGGSGTTPSAKTVNAGSSVTVAGRGSLTYSGKTFTGWNTNDSGTGTAYAAGSYITISRDVNLYAQWTDDLSQVPSNLSLDDALTWITTNAVGGSYYTITLKSDETIAPKTLSYDGKNIGITIQGGTLERRVSLSKNGTLFTVGSGVTLTLDSNVTLQGWSSNTASLVSVNSGGWLIMDTGSKIRGNTVSSSGGGGVYVRSNGTFTMEAGEISGNSAIVGGGVSVSSGTFIMNGGDINGNTSTSTEAAVGGGGVYVTGSNGTFTMNDGNIRANLATRGGGVFVASGAFTMNGGVISTNSVALGGGVYVYGVGLLWKMGISVTIPHPAMAVECM